LHQPGDQHEDPCISSRARRPVDRLSAPPRGYHRVQTGSDYVLAGIATGVILQVILDN
jgi:Ni/Co efflux regulator RcnB